MTKTIKHNLKLFQVTPPFEGYFGTIIDLHGEWTQEMLQAHDDANEVAISRIGLSVWQGDCSIAGDGDDTEYTFHGAWRAPSDVELDAIGKGLAPFSEVLFPSRNALRTIPEK